MQLIGDRIVKPFLQILPDKLHGSHALHLAVVRCPKRSIDAGSLVWTFCYLGDLLLRKVRSEVVAAVFVEVFNRRIRVWIEGVAHLRSGLAGDEGVPPKITELTLILAHDEEGGIRMSLEPVRPLGAA